MKRNRKRPEAEQGSGFTVGEMVFLLLLVCVFLAGTVLLVGKGVESLNSRQEGAALAEEGERLQCELAALLKDARAIYTRPAPGGGGSSRRTRRTYSFTAFDFIADLDGDGATGGFEAGGAKGLERVVVRRSAPAGPRLLAEVHTRRGGPPESVVLTGLLDTGDPGAFRVGYTLKAAGGGRAGDKGRKGGPNRGSSFGDVCSLEVSFTLSGEGRSLRKGSRILLRFAPVAVREPPAP